MFEALQSHAQSSLLWPCFRRAVRCFSSSTLAQRVGRAPAGCTVCLRRSPCVSARTPGGSVCRPCVSWEFHPQCTAHEVLTGRIKMDLSTDGYARSAPSRRVLRTLGPVVSRSTHAPSSVLRPAVRNKFHVADHMVLCSLHIGLSAAGHIEHAAGIAPQLCFS